jgi:4-amino-4-deoxy-L-arabinose transferase-like glycosyltransferase
VSDGAPQPERHDRLSERERTKVQDRFGMVLLLLIITVFFSIAAPHESWAWLAAAVVLAAALGIAILASGAQPKVVGAGLCVGGLDIGASVVIAVTQAGGVADTLPSRPCS